MPVPAAPVSTICCDTARSSSSGPGGTSGSRPAPLERRLVVVEDRVADVERHRPLHAGRRVRSAAPGQERLTCRSRSASHARPDRDHRVGVGHLLHHVLGQHHQLRTAVLPALHVLVDRLLVAALVLERRRGPSSGWRCTRRSASVSVVSSVGAEAVPERDLDRARRHVVEGVDRARRQRRRAASWSSWRSGRRRSVRRRQRLARARSAAGRQRRGRRHGGAARCRLEDRLTVAARGHQHAAQASSGDDRRRRRLIP